MKQIPLLLIAVISLKPLADSEPKWVVECGGGGEQARLNWYFEITEHFESTLVAGHSGRVRACLRIGEADPMCGYGSSEGTWYLETSDPGQWLAERWIKWSLGGQSRTYREHIVLLEDGSVEVEHLVTGKDSIGWSSSELDGCVLENSKAIIEWIEKEREESGRRT
jgi:hypothetical protein